MSFDMRAVDGRRSKDTGAAGNGLEHRKPEALSAPTIEAIVDRRIRPVIWRAISPTGTAMEHVDDAADHASVVNPVGSTSPTRQQRLYSLPLRIAQPVKLLRHSKFPANHAENFESRLLHRGNLRIEYRP